MASKFKGILDKAKEREPEPSEEEVAHPPAPVPGSVPETKPKKPDSPAAPKKLGRPTGKRSDGEHVQVTAYIRGETHRDVKIALLKDEKGQEFSELIQELLTKWLKSRT
jgi:hypothetical protein